MNDSISEKEINGCGLEQSDEISTSKTTSKVTTNVTAPWTTKKVESGQMKMSRQLHQVIFSYWNLTKIWWILILILEWLGQSPAPQRNRQVIGLPNGKTTLWQQKFRIRDFGHMWWSVTKKWQNVYSMLKEGLIHYIWKVNVDKNWKGAWPSCSWDSWLCYKTDYNTNTNEYKMQ